jgi:hypothetical protein
MRQRRRLIAIVLLVIPMLTLDACQPGAQASAPTDTPAPTHTPFPTATPYPTYTPYPTPTPYPTYTPYPSPTPEPAATAVPTASPMPEPTATSTPAPTAVPRTVAPEPPASAGADLFASVASVQQTMNDYGGMIDTALGTGFISCNDVIGMYDFVAGAPAFEMGDQDPAVQNAYGAYRQGVDIFSSGVRDLAQVCRDILADPEAKRGIPSLAWATARLRVNEALGPIGQAVSILEQLQ